MSDSVRYYYRCYGLVVASALALPELAAVPAPAAGSDVEIVRVARLAPLPQAAFRNAWLAVAPGRVQVTVPRVASYRVLEGRRIEVALADGVMPEAQPVRLYLLGSVLGALLFQRGDLPLHVGAVAAPSGGWAFTGDSGAGKSSLAAWLHVHRGWPMIADDVAVVRGGTAAPRLYSGPARIKLWADAMTWLGLSRERAIADEVRPGKFHLPASEAYTAAPVTPAALVVLARGEGPEPRMTRLSGLAAFQALWGCIYLRELGELCLGGEALWQQVAALGTRLPVYRLERPWGKATMHTSLGPLLEAMEAGQGAREQKGQEQKGQEKRPACAGQRA